MQYEFKKNGVVSLVLRPDTDPIEKAFFDHLFAGEVEVVRNSSANHPDEVIIRVKKTVIKAQELTEYHRANQT